MSYAAASASASKPRRPPLSNSYQPQVMGHPAPPNGNPMMQMTNPMMMQYQRNPQQMHQAAAPAQGVQNQGLPNQGLPNQSRLTNNTGFPNQGLPTQGLPPQGLPNQGLPTQGLPNHFPNQGMRQPPQQHMYSQPPIGGHVAPNGQLQGQPVPQATMPTRPPVSATFTRQQKCHAAMSKLRDGWTMAKPVQVLSGDTIEVKASIDNGAGEKKWEPRILTIHGIMAPKTARGQRGEESAFGWEAKDYLRSHLMVPLRVKFLAYQEVVRPNQSRAPQMMKNQGMDIKREFCKIVILDDETGNPDRNQDLAELMVKMGWCEVNDRPFRSGNDDENNEDPEVIYKNKLKELEEEARTKKLGQFSIEVNDDRWHAKTRTVEWILNKREHREMATRFYHMAKRRELDAVVDTVREGSIIRLEVLPDEKISDGQHRMVFVHLFGIKSPNIPMNFGAAKQLWEQRNQSGQEPKPEDHEPERFAVQAKEHTQIRLLGMKVKLVLEFCDDRGNLYGQIFLKHMDKKLNIAPSLVTKGLALVVPWQAKKMVGGGEDLFKAQEQARAKKLNIWSIPESDRLLPKVGCPSLKGMFNQRADAANKAVLTGRVTAVSWTGDCLTVRLTTGETKDYFLASLRTYRTGYGPDDVKPSSRLADQSSMYKRLAAAREFVREQTIAKKAEVIIEEAYSREVEIQNRGAPKKQQGQQVKKTRTKHYATVYVNHKGNKTNLGHELCKLGYAEALSYDPKNNERSISWVDLSIATEAAKKEGKGYHSEKFEEIKFLDLTVRNSKEKAFVERCCEKLWRDGFATLDGKPFHAQVEYVFTGHKVKVIIDERKIFRKGSQDALKSMLSRGSGGTYCPVKAIAVFLEGVRCSDNPELSQEAKDMVTELIGQRTVTIRLTQCRKNNFFGSISLGNVNLNEKLVKMGLAEVLQFAKMNGQNVSKVWQLQEEAQKAQLKIWTGYIPQEAAQQQSKAIEPEDTLTEFVGTCTHVESGSVLYVVPDGSKDEALIQSALADVKPDQKEPPKIERQGIYAGQFGKDFFRCKVERRSKDKWAVLFIDFGNTFDLKPDQIKPLPNEIVAIPAQAKKVQLAFLEPPQKRSDVSTYNRAGQTLSNKVMEKTVKVKVLGRAPYKPPDVEVTLVSDGKSMNEEMTETGLLRTMDKQVTRILKSSNEGQKQYINRVREKERMARLKRQGIWQFGDPDPDEEEMY